MFVRLCCVVRLLRVVMCWFCCCKLLCTYVSCCVAVVFDCVFVFVCGLWFDIVLFVLCLVCLVCIGLV